MPKPKVSRAEKLRARLFTSSPPMRPTSPPRTVFPFRDHPRGHATRRDSNPKRVESSKGAHGSAPGSSRDAAWPRHAPGFEPEARERRDARGAHFCKTRARVAGGGGPPPPPPPPPLPIMPTTTDRARQHSARRRRDRDSSPWEEERGAGRAGKARTLDRAPRRRWSMRTRGARSSGSTRARRASAGVGQAFGRTENVRSPRARRRFRRGKR